MSPQALANLLNGREYRKEITAAEEVQARFHGLVVVYGASDDLMEFAGAIHDELGAYDGTTAYLTGAGLLQNECENDECPHFEKMKEKAATIDALWCAEGDYSWTFKTAIPHEEFQIVEDGEPYCRGIVFALADVGMKPKHPTIALSPVKSSQIHAIGRDPATSIMHIQFKGAAGPGSTYAYENVSLEQFAAFKGAESIGHHFGAHFKKNEKHPYKKLGT
mgnify:CR=1 FL=1